MYNIYFFKGKSKEVKVVNFEPTFIMRIPSRSQFAQIEIKAPWAKADLLHAQVIVSIMVKFQEESSL